MNSVKRIGESASVEHIAGTQQFKEIVKETDCLFFTLHYSP